MKKYLLISIFVSLFFVIWCNKTQKTNTIQNENTSLSWNIKTNNISLEEINKNIEKNKKATQRFGKVINILPWLEKDSKNVYYHSKIISNADTKTFSIIYSWKDEIYAKDKNSVYLINESFIYPINCDPNTVKILDQWYIKDSKNIYWRSRLWILKIDWADMKTFKILTKKYAKDKNNVYTAGKPIKWADPETFQLLRSSNNFNYAKDKNKIYFWFLDECKEIYWIDYNTFQDLWNSYAKDKNNVYRLGTVIEWANPETFQVLSEKYTKDKNNVYRFGDIMKWADPETFEILKWEYAKDKNNVYLSGEPMKWTDPKTFNP